VVQLGPRLARWWTAWTARRSSAVPLVVQHDPLSRWEEAGLITVGAASAFNLLLWGLGATLATALPGFSPLGGARILFALVSFVAMDLIAVVTVLAKRQGRRGFWSEVSSATAAATAACIALDVAGWSPWAGWSWAWLHGMPAVVLYAFSQHVASPRAAHVGPSVDQLQTELDQARTDAGHWRATAEAFAAQLDQLRAEVDQRPALVDQSESDAALTIAGRSYSQRALAQALGMNKSTLVRRLAAVDQEQ
jgi:hypothetical protein